ncbi:polypyrimidine tract-binding protein [Citrus sinensis]|uniref:Polypyrimidine tract-binding protein n=1 Tax=Citrus sinensis TaxID=2711 RepID=A0ACB8KT83_CITSI|nr:polypyrimidine tract-binding protein [Citrus sinensis]
MIQVGLKPNGVIWLQITTTDELVEEYQLKFSPTVHCFDYTGSSSSIRSTGDSYKKATKWMTGFDDYVNNGDCAVVADELYSYLDEKVIPRMEDFNILSWWKTNANMYPTLARIARDILAIPITTVASESAFSTSGRVVSPHRLKSEAISQFATYLEEEQDEQDEQENDLLQLFQPFGVITKLVMLRAKNQALLQMQDVPSAINALQFYTNVQPTIRGRNVYVQFSSHQELTTMEQNAQGRGDEPNRILLVTIHHMLYPITVEVLHQVFSPHGFVEKIVTFQKSAGFQALIQYQLRPSAVVARSSLQGRNIYDGCCQLDIQFSNLDELQVNYNNERSRDFTNPNLPAEQKGRPSQSGYSEAGGMYAPGARAVAFPQMANAAAIAAAFGGGLPPGITGTNDRCTVLVSNLNSDRIDEDKLFNLFSLYGNIIRIKLLRNKPDHALVQMGDGFQAELAVHFLKGALLFGKRLEVNFSKHPNITQGADTHEYMNSNLNRFNRNAAKNYRYCCSPTKMIHLSTLPQDVTEEEIVSHLEEHGSIVNTKLFEMNGKKQALVLFETEEQATEALVCKHASSLGGSIIRISFSQLQSIRENSQ